MTIRPLRTVSLLTLGAASACAWSPFPESPRVSVEPVAAILQLTGRGRMASQTQHNDFVDLRSELNMSDRDFGIGARIAYSDGFEGAELNFLRWEQESFKTRGMLQSGFGNLNQGDSVESDVLLNQVRLNYIAQVFEESELTELTFRFGAGLGLHHNQLRLRSRSQGTPPDRVQNLEFHDNGIPFVLGRFEAEWAPFALRLDGGFGEGDYGDLDGTFFDLAATLHYRVQKGISAWVGYWRYDLPSQGNDNLRPFEFDMNLQGYIAGVRFEF